MYKTSKMQALSYLLSFVGISPLAWSSPISPRAGAPFIGIDTNFPDPAFINTNNGFFAFSTTSGGLNVPVAKSPDFQTWTKIAGHDALPKVGKWVDGSPEVWAPDVIQLPNGKFVMYYSAIAQKSPKRHCVGAAVATAPEGPYVPLDTTISCAKDQGGSIDASAILDHDGKMYVMWKIDGNNVGHGGNCNNGVEPIVPTPIMMQEVSAADGTTLIGSPRQILDRGPADGPLVEAPSMTRVQHPTAKGGWMYILFFSSNCYAGGLYDSSYATSVNGIWNDGKDYEKSSKPLLLTGDLGGRLYSPGGLDVGPGASNVLFHADKDKSVKVRQLWVGQITVDAPNRRVSVVGV